jgi:peptidylprolyl isomerase domain and WD repeat-containing protein 1
MEVASSINKRSGDESGNPVAKKRKLKYEAVYLEQLPCTELYEKSYLHRDIVTHVAFASATEFLFTASVDGHIKFWKKQPEGIEFVKHFRAHLAPVRCLAVSADSLFLASISADQSLKIYDVKNFGLYFFLQQRILTPRRYDKHAEASLQTPYM